MHVRLRSLVCLEIMGRRKKRRFSLFDIHTTLQRNNSEHSVVKKTLSSERITPKYLPFLTSSVRSDDFTVLRKTSYHRSTVHVDDSGPSSSCASRATLGCMYMQNSPFIMGPDTSHGDCVAVDCEMVGTGLKGSVSMLGRCAVINHHGHVLYDTMVAPLAPVTDYRTPFSGIRKSDLKNAPSFVTVQEKVRELLRGKILVGHDIHCDLAVLEIRHPQRDIRDTSRYTFCPFMKNTSNARSKLKTMFMRLTGFEIQIGEHCPIEDARAAMVLYQRNKEVWEASLIKS